MNSDTIKTNEFIRQQSCDPVLHNGTQAGNALSANDEVRLKAFAAFMDTIWGNNNATMAINGLLSNPKKPLTLFETIT